MSAATVADSADMARRDVYRMRSLALDVLSLHAALAAALEGRITPDQAARAARRAAQSARPFVWGHECPICGRNMAARPKVWVLYSRVPYEVKRRGFAASWRSYCSEHCALTQLRREEADREL